jgi:hypothetical protein
MAFLAGANLPSAPCITKPSAIDPVLGKANSLSGDLSFRAERHSNTCVILRTGSELVSEQARDLAGRNPWALFTNAVYISP